jgi:hypothetical protein
MTRRRKGNRYEQIVREYLRRFQTDCQSAWMSGASSVELATRPTVHDVLVKMLTSFKPEVVVHHDSKLPGTRNRPDWRIEDSATLGIYAFGDHKSLDPSKQYFLKPSERKQIDRYIRLGRPVFVFDGIEFLFFGKDAGSFERMGIVSKPLSESSDWSRMTLNPTVEQKLRQLVEAPGFRPWTEGELIRQLAYRASDLSARLERLFAAPATSGVDASEEHVLGALASLKSLLEAHHDPTLRDDRVCADFIAQVITFGLFFSHTQVASSNDSPDKRRRQIEEFWLLETRSDAARQLRPFRTVVSHLRSALLEKNELASWFHEASSLLAHAEYIGVQNGPRDFHALFEQFLDSFDRQTKFERGMFYTPATLADWMARACDELSKRHFGGLHLQDAADKIIDPCCGTGGLLEAVLKLPAAADKASPEIVGFEIMPAPYALAHYRLDKVITSLRPGNQVEVLLTDTLSDQLAGADALRNNGFADELAAARRAARPPLQVVIGNPPSSDRVVSEASRLHINRLLDDFRPPRRVRSRRQNVQKALNNEAIRFLRWSVQKVLDTGAGIVALVLPGSFGSNISFAFARAWLANNFDFLYVVHLDEDARAGIRTESLFDVLQGRMVILAVLLPNRGGAGETTAGSRLTTRVASVSVWDISGNPKATKLGLLADKSCLARFVRLEALSRGTRFLASKTIPQALWDESWPLVADRRTGGIFLAKCSGVKLSPSGMLFHTDNAVLRRRTIELASIGRDGYRCDYGTLFNQWWQGQRKPPREAKLSSEVRDAARGALDHWDDAVRPYSFRPFVLGHALLDNSVMEAVSSTPGGGARLRPEVRAAFERGAIGLAISPAPRDLGDRLTRFASFAWHVPDNDLSARGNAMVYCDRFPVLKRGATWDARLRDNVTPAFVELFGPRATATDAVYFVYAVINSSAYLSTFQSVLFVQSDPTSPFRIPVPSNMQLRLRLLELGRRMAECELVSCRAPPLATVSVTWLQAERAFKLIKFDTDVTRCEIVLTSVAGPVVRIAGVPVDVLTLRISGHDVVSKWLRERTFAYLRRELVKSDIDALIALLARVSRQIELIGLVDEVVAEVLVKGELVPPPASHGGG